MGLFQIGNTWYIDYYNGMKRVRHRVGHRKDEARILLSERLKDLRQGRNPELREIEPKPFAEMVTEFLEKHARHCRDYRSFVGHTKILMRYFGKMTLQEITPGAVQTFINDRLTQVSKATTNRNRSCLSGIFSRAKEWGYYQGDNPVKAVKSFRESPGRLRYLTPDEAEALIRNAADHQRPIIITGLHTGGRHGEILLLGWEDVDLENRTIYFNKSNTKSGKQREIPISPVLYDTLRQLKKDQTARVIRMRSRKEKITGPTGPVFTFNGQPMKRLTTAFDRARKLAGLGADVTFHTLRHTFASWFMMNGGDLYRLQRYMGHSTITLTQRYAHLSPEHMREGVEFFGPPKTDRKSTGLKSAQNEVGPPKGDSVSH